MHLKSATCASYNEGIVKPLSVDQLDPTIHFHLLPKWTFKLYSTSVAVTTVIHVEGFTLALFISLVGLMLVLYL